MKEKLYRKRRHIKWNELLSSEGTLEMKVAFKDFCDAHPRMSLNRCAWNVLKRYYSTTTLKTARIFNSIKPENWKLRTSWL